MPSRTTITGLLLALFLSCAPFPSASLQAHTLQDEALPNVGVDEKPGNRLPLDLAFIDQDGRGVRLADYFAGRPVILTLNYYSCPLLCPLIFRNLATELKSVGGLSPGNDYRIVTISIDPEETVARAKAKAGETWRMIPGLRHPEREWPFLVGAAPVITEVARTAGVRYTKLGPNNFAHPSVILVLTPTGRIARYLYGIEQRPADLKLALLEASAGRIGGSRLLNRVILYCYHYDPIGKRYALVATNIMKIGGGGVLLLVGILLLGLWRREKQPTPGERTGAGR